jgi:hypothetical protein
MIHQIHGEINHLALYGNGEDWSHITYPNNMKSCTTCHTGGTASDNYKTKPSRMACGGCHTNVDFATGVGHPAPGGVRTDDTACVFCHDDAYVVARHSTVPTGANDPEFIVSLVITPPANGTHYVAGEEPVVTITLKNKSDGSDVAGTVYTTARDSAAGDTDGNLREARLYVYGPRTAPKPVLTAGAAVTPVPTQATQLFPSTTDARILTDATGFRYRLGPVPAGMTGTYFVRFYAADYGRVSDADYVTDSNAFLTIQIGNATAQNKISGDCTKCHGTGTAAFHDTRHGVVYDTDECISCHDLSGNHAAPLANRVHAVHSSSVAGDLAGADWSHVAYPVRARSGSVMRCEVCHSSGNVQFQQNVSDFSCGGCHADNTGALDHFMQNGGQHFGAAH